MERQDRPRYNPLPNLLSACTRTLKAKGRKAVSQYKYLRQEAAVWLSELYISLRRTAHRCHEALAGRRYAAPVSFLAVSGVMGLILTVSTLYTVSYAVYVDGENVGAVADQSTVDAAITSVEAIGSRTLGYDYTVDNDISYRLALTLRSDLTEKEELRDYFSTKMDATDEDDARLYEITVDGQRMGIIENKAEFNNLLRDLKTVYTTGDTISAEFVEEIQVTPVHLADEVLTIDQMRTVLTENTTGETTYTVVSGDTFNAIAYRNDMSMSDLKALNPNVNVNKLSVGQVLNVKELIPRLSIRTVETSTYFEPIPCPVQTKDDPNIYKGSSKIITQGVEGEALVTANVTRVNGVEKNREVLTSETLREPTTTIKAVGTKPRPKTASNGYYKWPCRGKITSYFGYRRIFGSRSYHSGIDIAGSYGAPIAAADGGKVTFSGYKGNYGYLVIITHDNGTQTYYGHNSSNLVSAGQRVYQGQTIARMGSTGRSTGNHCHFEVRIRGSAVNPLNYLP